MPAHPARDRRRPILVLVVALLPIALLTVQALGLVRFAPVLSGSMAGFVEAGDISVLTPIPAAALREGDVIAFHPPVDGTGLTLHRVVELVQDGDRPIVRTKGDANEFADPWTAQLHGPTIWRAAARVPALGHAVLWMQGQRARVVVLGAILATVCAMGLRRIWGPSRSRCTPTRAQGDARRAPGVPGRLRTTGVVGLAALLLAITIVPVVRATVTAAVVQPQRVSTSSVAPPTDLAAELLCDLGVPTAVRLSWTPSASPGVLAQEIWRVPPEGDPQLVATVGAQAQVHDDDLVDTLLALNTTYVVTAVSADWRSDDSNVASLLNVCDAPDPLATAEPVPTVEATVEPTSVPTVEATSVPTVEPTSVPTVEATAVPTVEATSVPTVEATSLPTVEATVEPVPQPLPGPEPVLEPILR